MERNIIDDILTHIYQAQLADTNISLNANDIMRVPHSVFELLWVHA